ncbi:hypothetical protein V5F59_20935 [Xanthobacter autotrophicus DSM 431]|uniref:hypothetical protein n=1 Tax=Xanthobacter nonsaccharivorans TaxID=3119912 RepID=UPI003727423B
MPGLAHGSVLISLVAMLFAALLVATPTLAVLTYPHERPAEAPASAPTPKVPGFSPSALA